MNMARKSLVKALWMGIAVLCVHSLSARAADVELRLSSREAFVGAPIVAQLSVDNAGAHDAPVFPDIPDVDVHEMGTPSRSTQTTIINGRRSDRTSVTYAWELTPAKAGKYFIPAISLTVDGATYKTEPISFVAQKSETGDLLFVDVAGARPRAYVGEALRLTLRIWIRPFIDSQYSVKLSESDMWGLISPERSRWGVFTKALEELAVQRQRPRGREVLRKDSYDMERSYYLYELETVIRPDQAGQLNPGDVVIAVAYPTGLKESKGFFSMGELALAGTRPLIKQAVVEPIDILPIPAKDRPEGYTGAVGQFDISASALPKSVSVGEPITLTLKVQGRGNMETLSAPDLASVPELAQNFRVPDEPLAGVMENNAKVFTVSLRPRHADVKQIPPIPLSYFDPRLEKFVTSRSEAIPLTVKPAETLSLDRVVSASDTNAKSTDSADAKTHADEPTTTATDHIVTPSMLHRPRLLTGYGLIAALGVPPLTFVGVALGVQWKMRREKTSRQRLASRLAKERLTDITHAEQVASAVIGYIADRLDESRTNLTGSEAIRQLRHKGGSPQTLAQATDLLAHCEEFRYGGSSPHDLEQLTQRAKLCVDAIEADMLGGDE